MRLARTVFIAAGVWGVLTIVPLYFLLGSVKRYDPPPVAHVEFYFGFLGVILVWQIAFFVIGAAPARLRPMMIPAMLEKAVWVATVLLLSLHALLSVGILMFSAIDAVWLLLFLVAYFKTGPSSPPEFALQQ